jgi:hypothetical protein
MSEMDFRYQLSDHSLNDEDTATASSTFTTAVYSLFVVGCNVLLDAITADLLTV